MDELDKMNRTERIEIRCDIFQKEVIKMKAKESNMSVSEYMLYCGLGRQLPKPMSEAELEAFKELRQFQTNFARISNYIKQYNDEALKAEVRELLEQTKKIKILK
ncbi:MULTISPECIES: hypothetical protein [Bacteria]|nr:MULTISPECIES: hypothetical protein [Bacteria]MDM1518122.1 hypothetical protein [Myroides odoratimimus]MDM1521576.1 hypothetical protein [Myroides odoratimimus]